jgi:hypothetical protein
MCGTFSLLTGVLIFLTGRRLFDGRVALVAAAAYVLCDSVLGQAAGGGPLSVGAFFVTASFWAAVVAAEAGRRLLAGLPLLALSGALCGAAFLTGYGAVAALPAVVVFAAAAFEDRRWTAGAIVCLAFAAVVAPWIARNLRCSGAPLGIAPHAMFVRCGLVSEDALDQTLSRLDGIRAAAVVRRHFLAELSGVFEGGPRQWGGGLVAALFFVSFFRAFGSGTAGRFRWSALLGIGLLGAGAAGGLARPVELALLLPVVMLVGSAFFFDLVEGGVPSDPGRSALLTGVFLLLAAAGTIARLAGPAARTPYPPYYPPLAAYVCGLLEPAEALCTDIPWATAWYGGRVSVLLPRSVDDVERLSKLGMPVGGVYLTTETGDRHHASELVAGQYRSWLPVLDRRVPAGFPFVHGIALPPGTRDQLFLTDRDRWGTGGNTVPPAGAAPPGTGEKPGPTSPAPPAAEPRVPIREPAARP